MHKNTITHGATNAQKYAKTSQGNASAAIAKAKTPNNTGMATRSPRQSHPVRRWFGALITVAAAVALVLAGCEDAGSNNKLDLSTVPPAVTDLSAAAVGGGTTHIALSWTLPTTIPNDAAKLQLRYATTRAGLASATPMDIATTRATILAATTYTLTETLTSGTEYHFAVLIVNSAGNALPLSGADFTDDASYVTTATPDSTRPGTPTNLRVTTLAAISEGVSVTVEWQNPVNAANIELSWTPATPAIGKETVTATADAGETQNATITLADDTTYAISVVAINSSNKRSSVARITNQRIDLVAPAMPTGVILTPVADGSITVSWTASTSSDVAEYEVLWDTVASDLPDSPLGTQTVAAPATSATTGVLTSGTTYFVAILARDGINVINDARTSLSATVNAVARIIIDSNNNTLIDISTLDMLNNVRCNLAGTTYLTTDSGGTCAISGALQCGTDGITDCTGYELMRSLDFATAGDYASGAVNAAWRPTTGGSTVVADTATATNAGWAPIGTSSSVSFLATFEGNNNSISNLYARRSGNVGLFGFVGSSGVSTIVRNLVLIDGRVYGDDAANSIGMAVGEMRSSSSPLSSISNVSVRNGSVNSEGGSDAVGGVVGSALRGTVNNSYSTAIVNGGAGADNIGGLVGSTTAVIINGSYASGAVNGGADNDRVGGLVGYLSGSSNRIIASHATGAVDGGTGTDDIGGLVGENNSSIIASYATGAVSAATIDSGTDTDSDRIGGLVGDNNNTIIASYATGDASGGMRADDFVGGLVGNNSNTITASYATGNASGGAGNSDLVGGLIGDGGSDTIITTSYATGNASGGAGTNDMTGALAAKGTAMVSIVDSYGFGSWFTSSEPVELHTASINPSPPSGITAGAGVVRARQLTAPGTTTPLNTAAPAVWDFAGRSTKGAWNFGSASQAPALVYADYDGTGSGTDYCALFPAKIPGTETPLVCGTSLLPGQPR